MDRVGLSYYDLGKLGIDELIRNEMSQYKTSHLFTFEIENNTEEVLNLTLKKKGTGMKENNEM